MPVRGVHIVTTASACKSQSLWSPNALPKLMAIVICHDILKLKCLCPSVKKDCYKCLNGATTRTNVTQRQLSSGHTRHKTLSELMRRQRRTRARLSVVFLIWIVSNQTATETATASHFDSHSICFLIWETFKILGYLLGAYGVHFLLVHTIRGRVNHP